MIFVGPGGKSVRAWVFPPNNSIAQLYTISGVTRDSTGATLDSCVVDIFDTVTNNFLATTVSDTNGNYSIGVNGSPAARFYAVAYKAGSPDVEGTTVNTLVSTPS